jgi:hypothetical protein
MARLARAVFPGHPHHVTQRGNGRAQTFFSDADYQLYRDLLGQHCAAAGVEIWSWVLMPNHVHLILVPRDEDGLEITVDYGDTCNNPFSSARRYVSLPSWPVFPASSFPASRTM